MELINQKEYWKKNQSHPQEEDHQAASGLNNLPRDIILDILLRLPPRSLMQSKCVCQAWCSLMSDPDLLHMHHVRATKNNPCLIFHCHSRIRNLLYFVDEDALHGCSKEVTKYKIPSKTAMPEFDIVGSCNGLLCSSDSLYGDQLHICNPLTGSHMKLPRATPYMIKEVVLGFGFHPITNEYKVVRIVYYAIPCAGLHDHVEYLKSAVQVFTLGKDEWRSKGSTRYRLRRRSTEALVNGALHWVAYTSMVPRAHSTAIVSFDLAEEKFQEVPQPDCGSLDKRSYHLLVLGGCLSAAIYSSDGQIEIWVMKDYSMKESWTRKFNIGRYMPSGLNPNVDIPYSIQINAFKARPVRVLCLLKNGEILLEYKSQALVSYNPELEEFKDLQIHGLPNWFKTVIHVGSLISVEVAVAIGLKR